MALNPDFPGDPHAILDPDVRWFPVDEALRESSCEIHDELDGQRALLGHLRTLS